MAETKQVVTELVVEVRDAEQGLTRVERKVANLEQAFDAAEGAANSLGAAEQRNAAAVEKAMAKAEASQKRQLAAYTMNSAAVDKSTSQLLRLYSAAERSANPVLAAQQKIQRQINATTELVSRRVITEQRAAATIEGLREKEIRDLARLKQANDNLAISERNRGMAANDNAGGANRRQNLTYQLFDIGQSGFGGMGAAMIAAQQGPQILQLYAGQGGVNAALKDTARLAAGAVAAIGPLGPIVAGAAAVGGAALLDFQGEIKETTGVAVSFGDTARGLFETVADRLRTRLGPAFEAIGDYLGPKWDAAWSGVQDVAHRAFTGVIQTIVFAGETIKFSMNAIAPAFKIAGIEAANAFLSGVDWMVEKATPIINRLIDGLNFITSADVAGAKIGHVDANDYKTKRLEADAEATAMLAKATKEYQQNLARIPEDPWGDLKKEATPNVLKQNAEGLAATGPAAKEAATGITQADSALNSFISTANGFVGEFFPMKAAEEQAAQLMIGLQDYGSKLTDLQYRAVENKIDQLLTPKSTGLDQLPNYAKDYGAQAGENLRNTIGSSFDEIFDGPIDDLNVFCNEETEQ